MSGAEGLELRGEGCGKIQQGARLGMGEGNAGAVQGEAAGEAGAFPAVEEIPQHGAAQVGHVYPDLVGAAGVQAQAHQAQAPAGGQHLVVGAGGFPLGLDFPAHGSARGLADGGVHQAPGLRRDALHQGQVFPQESGAVEGLGQHHLGVGVHGGGHQAAGALVQPVHRAKGKGRLVPKAVGQVVLQGVPLLAAGRLAGQGGLLVDDENILVFIDYIHRAGPGFQSAALFGQTHLDHLACPHDLVGVYRRSVQQHAVLSFQQHELPVGKPQPAPDYPLDQPPVVLRGHGIAKGAHRPFPPRKGRAGPCRSAL